MSQPHLAAFAYHDVTDVPTDTGFQRPGALPYRLTCADFRRHLEAIATGPCTPSLVEQVDLRGRDRCLLLTFDDGGKSALRVSEMLVERGWRAHFFVVTSLVGTRTFLDACEVRAIRDAGHVVGSHSHSHPDIFRDLPEQRMRDEWRISREELETILGEPCVVASVPGGDSSPRVARAAAAAGLRTLFTSDPRLTPRQVDGCWVLGRFCAKVATPPERIAELANFRGWRGALARRQLSVLARRSAPPLYRWYVHNTTRSTPEAGA